jgi:hypothetical protein
MARAPAFGQSARAHLVIQVRAVQARGRARRKGPLLQVWWLCYDMVLYHTVLWHMWGGKLGTMVNGAEISLLGMCRNMAVHLHIRQKAPKALDSFELGKLAKAPIA